MAPLLFLLSFLLLVSTPNPVLQETGPQTLGSAAVLGEFALHRPRDRPAPTNAADTSRLESDVALFPGSLTSQHLEYSGGLCCGPAGMSAHLLSELPSFPSPLGPAA